MTRWAPVCVLDLADRSAELDTAPVVEMAREDEDHLERSRGGKWRKSRRLLAAEEEIRSPLLC